MLASNPVALPKTLESWNNYVADPKTPGDNKAKLKTDVGKVANSYNNTITADGQVATITDGCGVKDPTTIGCASFHFPKENVKKRIKP